MEFLFIDGEKLCVYKDGEVKAYESNYIKKYREAALVSAKNSEWKRKGRTEMLLNEDFFDQDEGVYVNLHAIAPTENENELLYVFTVNDTSGIYLKYLNDEKNTEAHVLSSNQVDFTSLYSASSLLATVRKGDVVADLAIFSKDGSEYKCVTGGDSLDENPAFDADGNILFNSYGVGRDENNVFVGYGASEIYKLDLRTSTITEVLSHENYSFVKPLPSPEGIYCIKKPAVEKEKRNVFMDIIMIPVRIVQAIVGFVSVFVSAFSGKPLVSDGKSRGNGALARNYGKDEKRLFVQNNFIKVEQELERNKKYPDYGFIPRSWKLIEQKVDPKGDGWWERDIFHGVADYCVLESGELIFTNGKRIFCYDGEHVEKLLDVDFCLKVSPAKKSSINAGTPFENL